jgi:AcrR family transcriptional regulator
MTMVIAPTRSLRERKKAGVRTHIIAAAIELFSRNGISSVTVDQIAKAADVGKGTVYNYFAAKEDIVVAFMVEMEEKVQAKVRRFIERKGSLSTILVEFIRYQFHLKRPYYAFVRVFLGQMFTRTEQFLPYMVEMQKVIDPPLEQLFRGLRGRGMIRKDQHLADLMTSFKTIQLGLTGLWAVEGPPFRQTEKTLKHEIKLFCEGLGTKEK